MLIMTLTKNMEKYFKFIALYAHTGKHQLKRPYSNRIFWNDKILFATCGGAFIWTEAEENKEGFYVWEIQGNKFVKLEEGVNNIKDMNMDNEIFRQFDNFNFDFTFCFNKNMSFSSELFISKRYKIYFDFLNNNFIVNFSENNDSQDVVA